MKNQKMLKLRKESLELSNILLTKLEKISKIKVVKLFNDIQISKKDENTEIRRIKFCFATKGEFIKLSTFKNWTDKIKSDSFEIEFDELNKIQSLGGKEYAEETRKRYVEEGLGTFEEYDKKV